MHRSKLISTSVCGKQVQLYKFRACNYSNRLTNVPYNIGFRKRKHNSTRDGRYRGVYTTYIQRLYIYNALLIFDYISEALYIHIYIYIIPMVNINYLFASIEKKESEKKKRYSSISPIFYKNYFSRNRRENNSRIYTLTKNTILRFLSKSEHQFPD